jgi:hypothetical protein
MMQHPSLWRSLDLSGCQHAATALVKVPLIPQFEEHLTDVNLEFAVGVTDEHVRMLSRFDLRNINLNACQK